MQLMPIPWTKGLLIDETHYYYVSVTSISSSLNHYLTLHICTRVMHCSIDEILDEHDDFREAILEWWPNRYFCTPRHYVFRLNHNNGFTAHHYTVHHYLDKCCLVLNILVVLQHVATTCALRNVTEGLRNPSVL